MTIMDFNNDGHRIDTGTISPADHMEAVALELLGNPNPKQSKGKEWRYGSRGSLSIDLEKGTFFDNEQGGGGGVLALIQRERNCDSEAAAKWLKELVLHQPPPTRSKPTVVETYAYQDAGGQHLFDVIRYEPKDFRQRAANGAWTVKGIPKVLYRLPKLAKAPEGAIVYLVEGEKDVKRLEMAGLLATTNAGGAGKWSDDYAVSLKGKQVVIVPDNDKAGRDHADTVRASLDRHGIACGVLSLSGLPEKGDVADWLDRGNTVAELDRLGRAALLNQSNAAQPKAGFHLIRSDKLEFKEPEYLIAGLIETETLSLLFADPGSGKSFIALDIAACVATGQPFHGREVRQGAVIYICGEGNNGINRRLIAWDRHHKRNRTGAPLYVSSMAAQFLSPEHVKLIIEKINQAAMEAGSVALIIIDTLNRNMGGGDESSTADMTAFIAAVDEVKDRYDAAAMIVHHTGHGNKERGRGSSAMLGALDAEYRVEKEGEVITVTNTKMKDAAPPPPIAFELVEVEVGTSRLGEPITSAALTETDPPEGGGRTSLSPNQKIAMEAMHQFVADRGQPTPSGTGWPETGTRKHVDTGAFLEFLEGKMTADKPDSRRRTAKRALADLQTKGLVQTNAGSIWVI